MVAALERAAGPEASALIDWVPDPVVAGLVMSWPTRIAPSGRNGWALPRTRTSTRSSPVISPSPGTGTERRGGSGSGRKG